MKRIAIIAHLPIGNRAAHLAQLVHALLASATYRESETRSETLKIGRPDAPHYPPACLPETCETNHAVAVIATEQADA
jgi:hypothetical protein